MVDHARYKTTASISISKYLLNRAKELVDADEFGSVSDVITTALSEFFVNYDARKKSQIQKSEFIIPRVIE